MSKVSLFPNAFSKKSETATLENFIENIRIGTWQDPVSQVRLAQDRSLKQKLKLNLPAVTISGIFENGKSDGDLRTHSGYISGDFDGLDDVNKYKSILDQDRYTASVFVSCGGFGLCVIVKIDPKRHEEAFEGLRQYYFQQYGLIMDPSGRNVGRLRFASWDPETNFTQGTEIFKLYPEKERKKPDTRQLYFGNHDIDHVFDQIQERKVDITGNYLQWCSIGFALANHYGEAGRERFHAISQYSHSYDSKLCDKQYDSCIKHDKQSTGKKNTIATFLWYAKQHGISIQSEITVRVIASAKMGRNGSNTIEGTVRVLEQLEGISPEISRSVVQQVYASEPDTPEEQLPVIVRLQKYWKEYQSQIRRNTLNRKCYKGTIPLTEKDLMDIYMDACLKLGTSVSKDQISDILKSSLVPEFHPIREFLEKLPAPSQGGHIQQLAASLNAVEGHAYSVRLLTKWLISCIASAYGNPSEVMLVLRGKQGVGKSHFFLNLLPVVFVHRNELLVEGYLTRNQDQANKMLLAQRWIVLDDEFQSIKNLSEEAFKATLSTKKFLLRLPYDRIFEEHDKLATFCATTNESRFLKDMTGNRRFAILTTNDIDHQRYNSVDKLELWKEVYQIYLQNPNEKFTSEDFTLINEAAEDSRELSAEEELIAKHFKPCQPEDGKFYSATEICQILERNNAGKKLDLRIVGKALVRLGFHNNEGKAKRIDGGLKRGFWAKFMDFNPFDVT